MKTETIWSASEEKDIAVEFTDEQHAAMTTFVKEQAENGEWFTPSDVEEHMSDEWKETDTFDTTAIVQVFLPPGFGVEMHGWEDFIVVPVEG